MPDLQAKGWKHISRRETNCPPFPLGHRKKTRFRTLSIRPFFHEVPAPHNSAHLFEGIKHCMKQEWMNGINEVVATANSSVLRDCVRR